ncbi:hypothetical protein GOBAR_AA00535 [Gossypium barbadense]|uniref:Uncharacterized protein n=1 Tax=Gossypium barbadense TaxID=3634 RepID=A0A2P5YWW7_GOSBA|nr:hypothetical protein GOBAR_AA00535 [Gossypium barbadense]
MMELQSNLCNKNRATHKKRRLQIDELDEWRTNVKEKPKAHDESKRHLDKRRNETMKFKAGDKVLLDEKDPQISTSELNTNRATPFMVLNVFPYGTVKVNHSQFDTFKVKITRLKLYEDNRIDSKNLSERFTRFEQQCFERFDSIDATLRKIYHQLHISSPVPPAHDSDDEDF